MKRKIARNFKRFGIMMAMVMLVALGIPMALSADTQIPRKEAGLQSYPVTSGEIIYKGAVCCVDADGYLVAGANTAGYKFAGIAYEQIDNSAGSDGDLWCRVHTEGVFQLTCTSITQVMVGQYMYLVDDATVDDAPTAIVVGKLVQYVSATSGWVDIGQRGMTLDNTPAMLYRNSLTGYTNELGEVDYGDLTVNGASGGHIYGRGSWINLASGAVPGAGHIHVPWEGGIYDGGATLTNARLVFGGQYQAILSGSPASLHCWRLNTTQTITALIAAANSGSVGYVAGTGTTSNKVGDLPLVDVAGGPGVRYVRLYDAAG